MVEFVNTADGSKTLYHPQIGEHYHSRHGAVQESRHVFLKMGLQHVAALYPVEAVSILEIGFGTGLNFLVSADHCQQTGITLDYVGIEAYPLATDVIAQTGYDHYVSVALWDGYLAGYMESFTAPQPIFEDLLLEIKAIPVLQFSSERKFDILYFDAFAAVHQPEMWTEDTLRHVCNFLKLGGIFVTYAITGHLKRTLKGVGFKVEKVPGAPGKREMLRAVKQ